MAQAQITPSPPTHPNSPGVPIKRLLEIGAEQAVEVIDGEMIVMSPQKLRNTRIAGDLAFSMGKFTEGKNLGTVLMEITYAPEIDERKRRVQGSVVPDVAFISRERYAEQIKTYGEEDFLRVAPDLVIEIVSPDDKYSILNRKIELYLQYGTRLVLVIDPQLRNARVVTPDNPAGQLLDENATLFGDPVLPGWSISLKQLLDGA